MDHGRDYPLNMFFKSLGYCRRCIYILPRYLREVHDYGPKIRGQVISQTGEEVLLQV